MSADVQDACCAEDILVCEDKLKILNEENELFLPDKPQEIEQKMKEMNITHDTPTEDEEESRHEVDASLLGLEEEDYDARRMRLDYREGRLLLHSTAHPADGHLSFKVRNALAVKHTCLSVLLTLLEYGMYRKGCLD